ncbi:MAG: biotin carboxylase N-terminal domain-containing protein [Sphingorhabdus sp.]
MMSKNADTPRPIRRLLIANRGEIAVRIARTAREMGISPVTVYSDADVNAGHVRACDGAVAIGGMTPGESYLRGDVVIAAAKRLGADAIHPGYGFLSENAAFAKAVEAAGLNWVGPKPDTITVMGDKVQAKRMMEAAGVPVLVDVVVEEDTDLQAAAAHIPLPIIAKAAAGGGGKGMRLIEDRDQLEAMVEACRREAAAAFGDDRIFLERFLPGPRHIEVQIVGDTLGNVIHLFERECSIQRRHQKVVEEAPSSAIDEELREQLTSAAVAAGKALHYEGVGTVEFVVGEDRSIAFLEVNTRLQVEHPITEAITGLDLVRLQLEVAQGRPLPLTQDQVERRGHAIEARLYAEDPATGYLPAAGDLHMFEPDLEVAARWDSGFESGALVSPFYDPLLAKVIAFAESRTEAARLLERALQTAHLQGPPNNRDLLCAILSHEAFLEGATTTAFLAKHFPDDEARRFAPTPQMVRDAAIVAALAGEAARNGVDAALSGWRNNPSMDQQVDFGGTNPFVLGYRRRRDGSWLFTMPGEETLAVRRFSVDGRQMDVEIDGHRFKARYSSVRAGETHLWEVTAPHGHAGLIEEPRFPQPKPAEIPGATRAPMHGLVVVMAVKSGDRVVKGQLLCIVEAMKMEHQLLAPHSGVVASVSVEAGAQVETEQTLVIVDEDEEEA